MKKEIVIARYNENVFRWLRKVPDDVLVTIYAKGGSKWDFCPAVRSRAHRIIPLPNTGREGHTYLTHIVDNYNNLADITLFVQGNPTPHLKGRKIADFFDIPDPSLACSRMRLASNGASRSLTGWHRNKPMPDHINRVVADSGRWTSNPAVIPFPLWWTKYVKLPIPRADNVRFSWNAIFSVTKPYVWTNSRRYYKKLLQTVTRGSDPEEGHFLERAWSYIFKP